MSAEIDKGAHFYRCDLQVHTPRDARWSGARAVSSEERSIYAKELIQACRKKGLNAIAITDHHDFAFLPYIRNAARSELDWLGDAVPARDQIVVFPGLELTLSTPTCQAILILDADFPDNLLPSVLNVLAIAPIADSEESTGTVHRIPADVVNGLRDLYSKLNHHDYLRGRFIVLPNVSESGNCTLLRSGFADHYKKMPCVGGFLDGSITQLGAGNRKILSGRNVEYGSRSIALFQTSDNRRRDHADLGVHSTWVKWVVPSAEALRQACLAESSRISQEPPQLPTVVIRSLHVSNSAFLGHIDLYLNPQYTVLIGSRGTGKSTVLEYLRWGLCDEHDVDPDNMAMEAIGIRQRSLVDNTLKKHDASVEVRFEVNGVPHLVRRRSVTDEIFLKIGDAELQPCNRQELRTLLPIEAYSQKQLSRVGHRVDELSRFVQSGIKTELDSIEGQALSLISESRQVYSQLRRKQALEKALREDRLALSSLTQQAQSIRDSLSGLTPEQQQLLSRQPQYLEADLQVTKWHTELREVRTTVAALLQRLSSVPSATKALVETYPAGAELASVQGEIRKRTERLAQLATQMGEIIGEALDIEGKATGAYSVARNQWAAAKTTFDEQYKAAKSAASSHESQLKALAQLEEKVRAVSERIGVTEQEMAGFGDPETVFRTLRTAWKALHCRKGDLYAQQAAKLTELSDGAIRATTRRGAELSALEERLRVITKGSGLRIQKIEETLGVLGASADPVSFWDSLLAELERLAHYSPADHGAPRPDAPALRQCGFTDGDLSRLADKLSPESWLELALTSLNDKMTFEYRTKEQEYIPFQNASAGQQATALLIMLLNQPGPPLVIDQPEDDLDNQVIFDIVKRVWRAKTQRQLIFSSHNANLVVNGDAELVIWCDYRIAGEFSGGRIAGEGAIDIPQIREAIKSIMEGGEKAFKLRLDKYGF